MNETQKPFACSEKDCDMTFTNEDHLNWHQKKHDMNLNLGLGKNDVADQTPTPTRFIRNCEEVGLFQDLQNVNPFDEIFKKAVEVTKNGGTLDVPETNSDDTLHTPHILPHVEESRKKNNVNSQDDNNSQSNEFSLNSIIPIGSDCTNEDDKKTCDDAPLIVIDDESDNERDVKKIIKQALKNKEKQRLESGNHTTKPISVVPFKNLAENQNEKPKTVPSSSKSPVVSETREKIREMNRAAQTRCRKRKQMRWKEMEEEICILKDENKRLKLENQKLRTQFLQLSKRLETDRGSPTPAVVPQIMPELNSTVNPVIVQIVPGSNATPGSNQLSSVKIESVFSMSTTSKSKRDSERRKPRKGFRKIIPKIIIEK